jgi:hypothetical protein
MYYLPSHTAGSIAHYRPLTSIVFRFFFFFPPVLLPMVFI